MRALVQDHLAGKIPPPDCFRPVWNAKLTAKARVVSRGKSIALCECDVHDEKGRTSRARARHRWCSRATPRRGAHLTR